MIWLDWLILGVVGLWAAGAVVWLVVRKKKGKSACGCCKCRSCTACKNRE